MEGKIGKDKNNWRKCKTVNNKEQQGSKKNGISKRSRKWKLDQNLLKIME